MAKLRLLAPVLGCRFDDLRQRDQQRYASRLRYLATSLAGIVLVITSLGIWAEINRRAALEQRNRALSNFLAARSQALQGENLELAALLAVESFQFGESLESRRALFTTVNYSPALDKYLEAGGGEIKYAVLSSNGSLVALTDADGNVRVRDTRSRNIVLEIRSKFPGSIEFSQDEKLLFRFNEAGVLERWDIGNGTFAGHINLDLRGFKNSEGQHPHAYFDRNRSVVALNVDKQLRFFSTVNGSPVSPLLQVAGDIETLHFGIDGETAVVNVGRKLSIIRIATGEVIGNGSLSLGDGYVGGVGLSPDLGTALIDVRIEDMNTNLLATNYSIGEHDGEVFVDITNRKQLSAPQHAHRQTVTVVRFSRDGHLAATGDGYGKIVLWDAQAHLPIGDLRGHTSMITDLAFSPEGSYLLSTDVQGTVLLWNLTRRLPRQFSGGVSHSIASPLLVTSRRYIDINRATSAEFNRADETLLLANVEGDVLLLEPTDAHSSHLIRRGDFRSNFTANPTAAFGDNNSLIAASDDKGRLSFWSMPTAELIGGPFEGHGKGHTPVDVHPRKREVVSAGKDGRILLWSQSNSQWKSVVIVDLGDSLFNAISDVKFSNDGKRLAAATNERIILWMYEPTLEPRSVMIEPESLRVISLDRSPVIEWSPDGRRIAYGGANGLLTIWDTETGKLERGPVRTDEMSVLSLAFSHDGRMLAAGGGDGNRIVIWDMETLQQIGAMRVNGNAVSALAFAPDRQVLVSGDSDGSLLLWNVDPQLWRDHLCSLARRRISHDEWSQFVGPDITYAPSCQSVEGSSLRVVEAPLVEAGASHPGRVEIGANKSADLRDKSTDNAKGKTPMLPTPDGASYIVTVDRRTLIYSGSPCNGRFVVAELGWDRSKEVLDMKLVEVTDEVRQRGWTASLSLPDTLDEGVRLAAWASCVTTAGYWTYKPVQRFRATSGQALERIPP